MAVKKDLFRILDANFNRAKEGLRVCEDISRYVWNKPLLTKALKELRHSLTDVAQLIDLLKVLESRDAAGDVGRTSSKSEFIRKDLDAVFAANMQRVKESLRVLEEISKLLKPKAAEGFKGLRYKAYVLEQKALKTG